MHLAEGSVDCARVPKLWHLWVERLDLCGSMYGVEDDSGAWVCVSADGGVFALVYARIRSFVWGGLSLG